MIKKEDEDCDEKSEQTQRTNNSPVSPSTPVKTGSRRVRQTNINIVMEQLKKKEKMNDPIFRIYVYIYTQFFHIRIERQERIS